MKKVFILICFLVSAIYSLAQFPISQSTGSPTTQVYSRGGQGADSGFIWRTNFPDTIVANRGFIKNIPGISIRTGNILWIRSQLANAWIQIATGTGGLFARTDARNNTGSPLYFSAAEQNFTIDSTANFSVTTTTGSMNLVSAGGITLQAQNGSSVTVTTTDITLSALDSIKIQYQGTIPSLSTIGDYKFQVRSPSGGLADYTGIVGTRFGIEDSVGIQNRYFNGKSFNLTIDSLGLYQNTVVDGAAKTRIYSDGDAVALEAYNSDPSIGATTFQINNDRIARLFTTYTNIPAKFYLPASDSLNVASPTRVAVWDADTLKSATTASLLQRFALEDNSFAVNRVTNMNNFRLGLDSGKVVIGGSLNSLSDSVFMVTKGGVPILRVDNVVGKVNTLEFGAYNNSFFVNGATAALGNAYPFLFFDNAYIRPYQQALRIDKTYPLSNLFNVEKAGVIISNDTLNAKNLDSADYYPFIVKFRSFVDNSERTRFLVNNQGSIYSARFNHDAAPDSVAVVTNGYLNYSTPAEIVSAGGGTIGGSLFTFQDSLHWIWGANYGIVYDGVTDNAAALKAMASAQRSLGWDVVFGPGIIYSSDSVTWNKARLRGYGTTIKSTSNSITIFNINDSCDVSGFTFIGNGAAAALPGGVFTLQDGIRMFGTKNDIYQNRFISLNGSGVNVWAGACCGYYNKVHDNFFSANTIGIFAMTNSEYLEASDNVMVSNFVGIYDRSSSNNRWVNNTVLYSVHSNFRLLGNGDHGAAVGNTFNHGNVYNVLIESCTLNYDFADNIVYTGNIGFGTVDTVHNFNWHGGTISGATITGSKVEDVVMQGFTEGSTPNTRSTTGVIYVNNLNSTDPIFYSSLTGSITSASLLNAMSDETGTGSLVFGTAPTFTTNITTPLAIGGTAAGSTLTLQSTTGTGTTTGVAINMLGGTAGATTLWQIANNGNIGSGFAATSGFKQIIKSLGTGSGTVHTLWRNASDQALVQVSDLGDCRIGNQSVTTSVNNFYNKNFIGGAAATTPTSWATFSAGTTTVAPINLLTGTSLTSAAAGSIEYTTPQLFFTNAAAIRQELFQGQQSRVSTQFDKTDATLANVTGLTANVAAGKVYRFEAILYTTSDIAGGVKVAIAGTATATNIIYEGLTTDAGLTTQSRATALATAVGAVTAVTAAYVKVTGTITVNAAGTLTVQFAENAATATSSVLVGSTFQVIEML